MRGHQLPPEGSDYWERLAGRIDSAVADRRARVELAWLGAHGVRVGGVGIAAAALLLGWALTRPVLSPTGAPASSTEWRGSLAPSDSLGRTLAVEQPPALAAFILAASRSGTGGVGRRGP